MVHFLRTNRLPAFCVALAAAAVLASLTLAVEPAKPGAAPAPTSYPTMETYKPDPNYKPTRDLSQFFAKVRAGRPVTVMGIGGSVTEGHSWAAMSAEWLQKQYPNAKIHYQDGAYGGTGPDAVVFRLRRDILPFPTWCSSSTR